MIIGSNVFTDKFVKKERKKKEDVLWTNGEKRRWKRNSNSTRRPSKGGWEDGAAFI